MKLLGFEIVRLKGKSLGGMQAHEEAIIDLQERVNALEKHRVVKARAEEIEATRKRDMHDEIAEILNYKPSENPEGDDIWQFLTQSL